MRSERFTFPGSGGVELAARLDLPAGGPRAWALLAHCFTCSKESLAGARIAAALAERGLAVLRFDFTGLGGSGGDFANTGFAGNVDDLVAAADHLRRTRAAPQLLVGHSLGGTALLAAAHRIPEARAVATVGAPFDPAHVLRRLGDQPLVFDPDGTAAVTFAGRAFRIGRAFLDDLAAHDLGQRIAQLHKALIVFHAPQDETVGIAEATRIFVAARHPKSFIGLDGADHLLSRRADGQHVGRVLAEWSARYLDPAPAAAAPPEGDVVVTETGEGRFAQEIAVGPHRLRADEPVAVGGDGSGPGPYDLLLAALGACTAMTLRLYAERKGMALGPITVRLRHGKVHARDCAECEDRVGIVDRIEREIVVPGELDDATRAKLLEIADKCPVHRTLEGRSVVVTRVATAE
ncbi:MAG: OsmC family protein [Alphaproteobacteria bacterium]|nr:OsmC family protein [Alphaproteobacteria bacterium]